MLSLAFAFSSGSNLTHADLERDPQQRSYRDVSRELLIYLKGARLISSTKPEQKELCDGLAALADMVDDGAYDRRMWALASLREAQELECVPLEGLALTAVKAPTGEQPWSSTGDRLRLGAFGPNVKEQAELEELDREAEWEEQRQKHALRELRRESEAFAWDNDVADVHPEDDALARWSLGKAYDDALPDSRLRLEMQRILGGLHDGTSNRRRA